MRTNIHGTENVVDAALDAAAVLVAASTSEIYGKKHQRSGLREDDDRILGSPLKSRWSYAEAKAIDESLIEATTREKKASAPSSSGSSTPSAPRQNRPLRHGSSPRFTRQALAGEPLTVYGTGEQIRCFCHVPRRHPRPHQPRRPPPPPTALAVNLGSTEQVTINTLATKDHHRGGITLPPSPTAATSTPTEPATKTCNAASPTAPSPPPSPASTPTRTLDTIIRDVIHDQSARTISMAPR